MNTRAKRGLNTRSSMNVHTLIDKFQSNDIASNKTRSETSNRPVSTPIKGKQSDDDTNMDLDKAHGKNASNQHKGPKLDLPNSNDKSHNSPNSKSIDLDHGLLSLLGPNIKSFPYSEQAYLESIRLRCQQEITKQYYYKVELANKNLAIIQLALRSNIPTDTIVKLCIDHESNLKEIEEKIKLMSENLDQSSSSSSTSSTSASASASAASSFHSRNILLPNISNFQNNQPFQNNLPFQNGPKNQQFQNNQNIQTSPNLQIPGIRQPFRHSPSHSHSNPNVQPYQGPSYSSENAYVAKRPANSSTTGGTPSNLLYPDALNASPVPPMNYRFGGGGTNTRRPLSPAKIGAQAVANLATPTSPYKQPISTPRRTRLSTSHQRHYSMPSQKELSKQALSLPMGGTSTIQVNPLPAQPLNKANSQTPSQESMTSFQHIIQFHHWKPELDGSQHNSGNVIFKTHKRHKSSSEVIPRTTDESSNLLKQENIPHLQPYQQSSTTPKISITDTSNSKRDDDTIDDTSIEDTEMETSKIIPTDADPNKSLMENDSSSTQKGKGSPRNIGRYPHDILSG